MESTSKMWNWTQFTPKTLLRGCRRKPKTTMFSITLVTLVGLWIYDTHERDKIKRNWCNRVAVLANEPLAPNQLRRRITVILAAGPGGRGDTLHAREHFHTYVKPILNAAALDWDVIEGTKEGQVSTAVAERIRRWRGIRENMDYVKPNSKEMCQQNDVRLGVVSPVDSARESEDVAIRRMREYANISMEDGILGDLIIGRHVWKEYLAGIQMGLLDTTNNDNIGVDVIEKDNIKLKSQSKQVDNEREAVAGSFMRTTPDILGPVAVIPCPTAYGFSWIPRRIYWFFMRSKLAKTISEQVVGLAFGEYEKFGAEGMSSQNNHQEKEDMRNDTSEQGGVKRTQDNELDDLALLNVARKEIQSLCEEEERYWPSNEYIKPREKCVKETRGKDNDELTEDSSLVKGDTAKEGKHETNSHLSCHHIWHEDINLDPRIIQRLYRFVMKPEVWERSQNITEAEE